MKTEIENYNACEEAVDFRKGFKTFNEAWENCERGDWMLWIAYKVGVDSRALTLAKGLCAELGIDMMEDQRSKDAVKAAIAYGRGEIGEEELRRAAYAAAAYAAYAADDASTEEEILSKCADICREVLTGEVLNKLGNKTKPE